MVGTAGYIVAQPAIWWTAPCPSSHCPPEFFFDGQVWWTILGGGGGGLQDFSVSPSPLWVNLGFKLGWTGLGLGLGGLGT